MLSRTGVLVVGVTSVARGRGRERERESPCVRPSLPVSSAPPPSMSTCVHVNVCQREPISTSVLSRTGLGIVTYWSRCCHVP
jgi:hypothetical protein